MVVIPMYPDTNVNAPQINAQGQFKVPKKINWITTDMLDIIVMY